MPPSLDFYFSFRSPYSYLAIVRLRAIIAEHGIAARLKIVRPLAMREPDFFIRARPQFLPYLARDVVREAARAGLPFGMAQPDPITMDMTSGKVAPRQPLMDQLIGLGFAASALGDGFAYASAVASLIWGGTQNWHEPPALARAASDAGLDHEDLVAWAGDHHGQISEGLHENETAQLVHHWGVPLMVLDGEAFFGQDRLDALVWRLQQRGLGQAG